VSVGVFVGKSVGDLGGDMPVQMMQSVGMFQYKIFSQ
jgi:hypothetical protein